MARKKNQVDRVVMERFARELEHRRDKAGLTQEDLGTLARCTRQTVGAVERCERPPTRHFAEQVDRALEAGGELLNLFPQRGAQRQHHLHEYVVLERRALTLDQWHPQVVPALLQTEEYARADLAATVPPKSAEELKELLRVRLERQKQVFDRPDPLVAQFVIDEGALRRRVGGDEVMAAQHAHIVEQAETNWVTVQVLPFEYGAHAGLHGACTILGMSPMESVLYVETMAGGQTLTDPALVAKAIQRFGALRASALSPPESLAFLRNRAEEEGSR